MTDSLKMVEYSKNSFKHFTTGVPNQLKINQVKLQICLLEGNLVLVQQGEFLVIIIRKLSDDSTLINFKNKAIKRHLTNRKSVHYGRQ